MSQFSTSRRCLRLAKLHPLSSSCRDGNHRQRHNRISCVASQNPVLGRSLCSDHYGRTATDGHGRGRRELLVRTVLGTVSVPSKS